MPVRPKPVATSSQMRKHAVLVAQLAHRAQVAVGVDQHPGRALHERLDDHRGDPVAVLREQRARMSPASPGSACQVSNSSGRYSEWKSSIPPTDTEPIVSPW